MTSEPVDRAPTAARISRDALTRAAYCSLAGWGWFLYSFGALLPLLRIEQHTSRTVMGMHSLAMSGAAVVVGTFNLTIMRRLRRRGAVLVGAGGVAVGVLLLALAQAPWQTIAAAGFIGVFGSLMMNGVVLGLAEHHGPAGSAVLSEANGVGAVVGLIAPLAVGAAARAGLTWRPAALVLVPLMLLTMLLLRSTPPAHAIDQQLPAHGDEPTVRLPRAFYGFMGAVVATAGLEFAATAWSADLLRQRTAMAASLASASIAAIIAGLAVGRFVLGALARLWSGRDLLFACYAVTLVGWAVTWTSTNAAVAVLGLFVMGLGMGGHYPLGVTLVYAVVGRHGDKATGVLGQGVGLSAALAPFLLGAVADASSTHTAFLAIPLLAAVATVCLRWGLALQDRQLDGGAASVPDAA